MYLVRSLLFAIIFYIGSVPYVLTALIGAPITLGATTTDGLGFLGNSEGVAAVASALISRAEGRLKS